MGLFSLIVLIVKIYSYLIIANAILSWVVNLSPYNATLRQLYWTTGRLTEPIVGPIRRALYPWTRNIGLDFSPLIALILLQVLLQVLRNIL
jgi:YggT family protein